MRFFVTFIATLIVLLGGQPAAADEQQETTEPAINPERIIQPLAREFFEWRRVQQPASGDDIPRVERPDGWLPDFSPAALESQHEDYLRFFGAVDGIDTTGWNASHQIDLRLLTAAIQRVHWELEVLRAPHRNPLFYVDQTVGSVFELLVIASPMTSSRAENILLRLDHFPTVIKAAKANLDEPVRPFAVATIATLDGIGDRLLRMQVGLEPVFNEKQRARLADSVSTATKALNKYSKWLQSRLDTMQTAFAMGPHAYQWFLINVALIPYTADELLAQGQQAWSRSVAWDVIEQNRNRDVPPPALFENSAQQIQASFLKENEIRAFLESRDLMTVPGWLMHYRNRPLPEYLAPLSRPPRHRVCYRSDRNVPASWAVALS